MTEDKFRAAILIVSDTASSDPTTDRCIPVLREIFDERWEVVETAIMPDETAEIQEFIRKWTDSDRFANLIVTSGGTGFAVKDNTPEVLRCFVHLQRAALIIRRQSVH